ncbi:MAG: type II secretory pathway, component PulD [Verrucomicrobia bacterium]|nr:type II secretory pathway, component PulD [Verrucomicrobiota bacterium]
MLIAAALAPTLSFAQAAPAPAAAPAAAPSPAPVAGVAAAVPLPGLSGSDQVGPVILRDETVAQVLDLMQRWTGKSILRPQALPASVYTLSLPASITRDEALLAIETLLNLNGIAVIQQGDKFLKVVPNLVAKSESPALIAGSTLTLPPSGRIATKIYTLKHANAQEFVTQIISGLNTTLASPPIYFGRNNAFLVTDSITNLQKIEKLVEQLDKPQLDLVVTKSYTLKNAMATDMVAKLTAMLRTPQVASGGAPFRLSTGTTFLADERTNRVLLMGSADQHDFFDKLIETLDQKSNPNTKTDVIFLRHADAQQVATLVTSLVTGQTTAASRAGNTVRNTTLNRTPTPVAVPGAAGAAGPSQMGADEFSSSLTVLPDVRSNSVVVSGTNDDLHLLHDLIDKVDIVLPQVRIEVVIAEVKLSDNESNGFNTLGLTVLNGKLVGIGGTGAGFGVNGANATTNVTIPNTQTQLGAAQGTLNPGSNSLSATIGLVTTPRKGDLKILSVPAITTTHNKEATLFVGESRPVITGSTLSTTTGASTSTVSQRDIGITLKVLPLIGKDGAVQLQVSQSVEDILGTTILDGNDQPIIGRRTTDSYVSAMSGEIVVLGGLQRTVTTKSTSRLGPIPIIGDIFGSTTNLEEKQELIIFLRPYVLNSSAVDNLDALSRATSNANGAEVKKILDNVPGKAPAAPAAPEKK